MSFTKEFRRLLLTLCKGNKYKNKGFILTEKGLNEIKDKQV